MKTTRTMLLRIAMAIFLIAIIVAFFIGTFYIKQPKSQMAQSISARFFPRVIIALLAISSSICIWKELHINPQDSDEEKSRRLLSLVLSIATMGVSIVLLDVLGFIIVGFAFMVSEISIIKEKKPDMTTLLISAVCSVFFVLIFRYGFKIGIPFLPIWF